MLPSTDNKDPTMLQHLPIILGAPKACKFIQEAVRDIEGGN